ncbi:cytochrome c5 family protein [Inhella sp.]|uniref:c-type cytochrome n=1 Tax=Inhella sp. TaxID=1921806 RepID=UPI0035ADE9F1
MSHDTHEAHDSHEGPIKTPKQLAWAVFFAFMVPIVVIILLANYVSGQFKPAAGSESLEAEKIAERLKPIGHVEVKAAGDMAAMKTGEQVYQAQCAACHGTGAAGAPKLADAAAWGPRVKTGFEALLNSALKGKGAMGAQGGGDFSDFEISRAVVYMANQGGGKFDEPKAPAAPASAAQ